MSNTGEIVVRRGKANRLLRGEGVGGHLTLTTERVSFKAHRFNIQRQPFEIPLSHVAKAVKSGSLWNEITLTLADGSEEKFVVYKRRTWLDLLNTSIATQ